jgi:hypothetical protein
MKLIKNAVYISSVLLFVTTSLADDKGLVGWWKFDDVSRIIDLVIWIKIKSVSPINIELSPVK